MNDSVLLLSPAGTVLFVFFALFLQAFFAGYETGLVSLSVIRIEQRAAEGHRRARLLRRMLRRPDQVLTMCLVGTNLAVVFGTLIMVLMVGKWWTLAVYTPVILIFGELIPKSLFRQYATELALALVYVARLFHLIFLPLVYAVGGLTRLAGSVFGRQDRLDSPFLTREDVQRVVAQGVASGTIEVEERKLIRGVMGLSDTMAKEVMIPRTNVVAIDINATRRELFDLLESSGHTRIPVYRDTLDSIVGVVILYDLIKNGQMNDTDRISGLAREIPVVPDTKNVGELLYEMRTERIHMAVVLDEYGGTAGVVTIEDLVEEVFGEIQDEYDAEEPPIVHSGKNEYRVLAGVDIDDLAEELGIIRPEGEFETVGGFVMDIAGKIPAAGEQFTYENLTITVIEADEQGVERVRIDVGEVKDEEKKR